MDAWCHWEECLRCSSRTRIHKLTGRRELPQSNTRLSDRFWMFAAACTNIVSSDGSISTGAWFRDRAETLRQICSEAAFEGLTGATTFAAAAVIHDSCTKYSEPTLQPHSKRLWDIRSIIYDIAVKNIRLLPQNQKNVHVQCSCTPLGKSIRYLAQIV